MPEFHEWFGAELDKKLLGKSPTEAVTWLAAVRRTWEHRRARFYATEGSSEQPHPTFGMPTATDFLLFICEIDNRLEQMRSASHVLEGAQP